MTSAVSMAARLASVYGVPEQRAVELALALALEGPWRNDRRPLALEMDLPHGAPLPGLGGGMLLPDQSLLTVVGSWHRERSRYVVVGVAVGP